MIRPAECPDSNTRAGAGLFLVRDIVIGRRIHSRRKELALSLRELSARTHLTAGFLSQVENDRVSPSLNSLQRIATALQVPMFFFNNPAAQFNPVVRAGHRRRLDFSEPHMGYDLLTPELNRAMMSILIRMEPGARRLAAPLSKPTEQWMYVLQGCLAIQVAGQTHLLEAGDAIYFDGETLSEFSSAGADELRVICCMTPPAL